MGTERYVIQGGVAGRERLRLLSEVMGPATRSLLAEVGVPRGARCLDVGCGGGDVSFELARATGPSGHVLGVDLDETKLGLARAEAGALGLAHCEFAAHDVTAWEPAAPFDLAYARFLLTHLPDPAALLGALRRHLREGAAIVLEDIDFRGHFAEPPCPALDRFVDLYTRSVAKRGADANIGPRLPGLLRAAGFADVRMHLVQPASLNGGMKLLTCVTMESIAEAVRNDGLASEAEVRTTIDELRAFALDPHTIIGGPRVFQAWARR